MPEPSETLRPPSLQKKTHPAGARPLRPGPFGRRFQASVDQTTAAVAMAAGRPARRRAVPGRGPPRAGEPGTGRVEEMEQEMEQDTEATACNGDN